MENRKGYIKILDVVATEMVTWDMLQGVFAKFIPLEIETKEFPQRHKIYGGISKYFDIVKEGEEIPFYDVIFSIGRNEDWSITFKKV